MNDNQGRLIDRSVLFSAELHYLVRQKVGDVYYHQFQSVWRELPKKTDLC